MSHSHSDSTDRVSYSRIMTFLSCRKKFGFKYVDNLIPISQTVAINEGKSVHFLLERVFFMSLQDAFNELVKENTVSWDVAIRAKCAVAEFIKRPEFSDIKMEETEVELTANVGGKKGFDIFGYVDGIGTFKGHRMAFEYKKVSSILESTLDHVRLDNQSLFYDYMLSKQGKQTRGMMYVFLAVPMSLPKKAVPKDEIKYKKDGEPCANQQMADETEEEYEIRMTEWYVGKPDAIRFHLDVRTSEKKTQFVKWLRGVVSDMKTAIKKNRLYACSDACKFTKCPYSCICSEDSASAREGLFNQLSSVTTNSDDNIADSE